MKFSTVIAAICICSSTLTAAESAAPEFEWAVRAGGSGHDKTRGICTDASGNVFITGEFAGTAQFGEQTLVAAGQMDFFVAKWSAQGKLLWARSGGSTGTDRGYGVATDKDGNSYATGHFQSTNAAFGEISLKNNGDYDAFVAKYDANGKLLWVKHAGGAGYDYGHGVAVDKDGNAIVCGAMVGDVSFGGKTLTNAPGSHFFCAKYAPNGDVRWAELAQGKASNSGHEIAVDAKGNSYAGGFSSGLGTLAGLAITNRTRDIFVARLSPKGEALWLAQGEGSTNAMSHCIAADKSGNVWVSGMFKGDAMFGGKSATSKGDSDWLLQRYDPTGKLLWAHHGGGPKVDYALGVVADDRGNCYVTGEFSETSSFLDRSLTSRGATDIYVAMFDASGKLRWLQQAGGDKGDNAYTIALDKNGDAYISGSISGTAHFGKHSIVSAGGNDAYIAKLKLR